MVVGKIAFLLAVLLIYNNVLNASILVSQQEDVDGDDPSNFSELNSTR